MRAQRDQRRRGVADGGAVGDVAADGTHVAHLLPADAVPEFTQLREMTGDGLCHLGVGNGGAQRQRLSGGLDRMQFRHLADKNHRPDVAHELGDPQPDIGGSGNQRRARLGSVDFGQVVGTGGNDNPLRAFTDFDAPAVAQRRKTRLDSGAVGDQRVLCRRAMGRDGLGGAHDGRVAGAAAQIPLQRPLDRGSLRIGFAHPQRIERHHDARRTEAALAAVEIQHRLLHRVQRSARRREMLDGHHMGGVEPPHEGDAGGDGLVFEFPSPQPADQHGAGAAIALGAAFLGSGETPVEPEEIEQRLRRRDVAELDGLVVEEEAQTTASLDHSRPLIRRFAPPSPTRGEGILTASPRFDRPLPLWERVPEGR